eukprot:3195089-Amphidinium_carterae.1
MDYADGGDLHKRIQKTRIAGKFFVEGQVLRWFTEASLALNFLILASSLEQLAVPVHIEDQPYSYSSDIWALGCVLYELGQPQSRCKRPTTGANNCSHPGLNLPCLIQDLWLGT